MLDVPWLRRLIVAIAAIAAIAAGGLGTATAQPGRGGDAAGAPGSRTSDRGNPRDGRSGPSDPRDPADSAGPPGAPGTGERRERLKKRIRAMRAYQLTEELALDEQTAGKLFPLLSRFDDEIDRLLDKRIDIQRRLIRASTLRDGRAIDRVIDEAVANQRGFRDIEDRRLAELRKILTPGQAARILIVLPSLERKIERQLRRAIGQRSAPGSASSAPGSVDDEDDDPEPERAGPRPRQKRKSQAAPP